MAPATTPQHGQVVAEMCATLGVAPTVRVLLLPDYMDPRKRLEITSSLWRMMRQQLPGCEVQIHVGTAPLEDDQDVQL